MTVGSAVVLMRCMWLVDGCVDDSRLVTRLLVVTSLDKGSFAQVKRK